MKNELYKSDNTLDIDIGDMTVSVFAVTHMKKEGDGFFTDSHFHTAYEFQFASEGSFTIADEASTHLLHSGDFVVIPPGTFHFNVVDESLSRCTLRFSITSNGKGTDGFSEYCFYRRILDAISGITVLSSVRISRDVERIINNNSTGPEARHRMQIYTALLITDILQHIKEIKNIPDTQGGDGKQSDGLSADDERIKYIIETCISECFNTDTVSDKIAQALSMSKRNSARVVKRLLGENISDIVTKQRMHMAKTLIKKTDRQLNDIAEAVGYKTYVAFFTAFKKYYEISPTELRE